MKTIDELGISKTPWMTWNSNGKRVKDIRGYAIADCDYENVEDLNNARLIAAAPKLYKALCDACSRRCLYCKLREADGSCNQPESDCVVQQWKSVLEEAAGEEVK